MLDMLKRHAIQGLRKAGHSLPNVPEMPGCPPEASRGPRTKRGQSRGWSHRRKGARSTPSRVRRFAANAPNKETPHSLECGAGEADFPDSYSIRTDDSWSLALGDRLRKFA
jgi:hypothetical protein